MLQIAPDRSGRRLPSGLLIVGIAILVAIALALVWRYTPLADVVTAKSVIAFAGSFADYWWAPLAFVLSYTPATLVMFPRWLITLAAVAIFGPWAAFAYAQLGVVLAALCGYAMGKLVSLDTVRHMAGPRIHRLTRLLRRRGLVAVTLVRLVPIAPFIVVNVVMGAMRIRLHHYVIGTVIGMLPGLLATTVLGDQLTAAIFEPTRANLWIAAIAALALATIAFAGQRWLRHLTQRVVRFTRVMVPSLPARSAISANRHSALISRICSIVRACDSSSLGLATTNARHIAREIATFSRLRENRNSRLRGTSSTLDVAIE